MTYGIKVSKPGEDVKTCGDEDLVFSSQYSTLKAKAIGTLASGSTYAHGLAYVPIVFSIVKYSSTKCGLVGQIGTGSSSVDSTNVTAGSDIKYYVFYEQAV